jgi:hypothetical protein
MAVTMPDPTAPLLDLPPQPVGPPGPRDSETTEDHTVDRRAA